MTELELINEKLDKIGTELFNKFGTDSYNIRCELHDIKDQLKAINYSRSCMGEAEQLFCSCGSRKVKTTGGSQCTNNRCSL